MAIITSLNFPWNASFVFLACADVRTTFFTRALLLLSPSETAASADSFRKMGQRLNDEEI